MAMYGGLFVQFAIENNAVYEPSANQHLQQHRTNIHHQNANQYKPGTGLPICMAFQLWSNMVGNW